MTDNNLGRQNTNTRVMTVTHAEHLHTVQGQEFAKQAETVARINSRINVNSPGISSPPNSF